ncbi:MAG TPA: DUF6687 family protein [Chthonomonadaceae bacterium]|nr:DUF6687 family protein [Chthonomonadaceae bacterium]
MKFEVFHRGLIGRHDVIAVDMIHYPGLWGPCFSHHLPHNNAPRYAADTSTEGALRFLEDATGGKGDIALSALESHTITTHHFDADALLPVWALLHPEAALERRDLLERVARCGDFFLYLDDQSARLNFCIEALHQRLRGTGMRGERLVDDALTQRCFAEMLPRWGDLMEDVTTAADLWETPLREMQADLEYLMAPGRVTELWDRHTSLVETDHALDVHALNSVCRNDLLLVWRQDIPERRIDVRPAIGWYDLTSLPHRPRYDLAGLAACLNRAEERTGRAPAWLFKPGPMELHAAGSRLNQHTILKIIRDWLEAEPEERVPAAYRADVREVFSSWPRHAIYTSHRRFADADRLSYAPGAPYGGLHFQGPESVRKLKSAEDRWPLAVPVLYAEPGKTPLPFAVSDDFYWNACAPPLELSITYVDGGAGSFRVEYEAWREAARSTPPVTLGGDGKTHTVSFPLDEARLSNNLEGGCDLRLLREPGTPLAIREIRLCKKSF